MKPEVLHLSRVAWQVFGSLTFRQEKLPERVRLAMWMTLLRCSASWYRIHLREIIWALRLEAGEIGGRLHFHYLLAGIPAWAEKTDTVTHIMHDQWARCGGGFSAVRLYDATLAGADYITDCLSGGAGRSDVRNAANAYESAKFGFKTCELMLSENFHRVLSARAGGYGKGRGRTNGDTLAVCKTSQASCSDVLRGLSSDEKTAVVGVEHHVMRELMRLQDERECEPCNVGAFA